MKIIKKYPNRRLYDTSDSQYITIQDVRAMVSNGVDFEVQEAKSGDDITRTVLLQIIVEQESENNPLFSTDNLRNFIRFYSSNTTQGFSQFMDQSLTYFKKQQDYMRDSMAEMMGANPMELFNDLTKKNIDSWQEWQKTMFGSYGGSPSEEQGEAPKDKDSAD